MFRSTPHPFSLRRRLPLRLEMLERREVPAVLQVTNLNNSGSGSLRAAINEANLSTDADEIKIEVIGTLAMTGGNMVIQTDLTIIGPGSGSFTIASDGLDRIFDISIEDSFIHVSISGMTLTGGTADGSGGGIQCDDAELVLKDVIITDCSASNGGGIDVSFNSNLILDNCTISGNTAESRGGGIYLRSECTGQFRNSTIANNQAYQAGGGIDAAFSTTLSIERCTIAGNSVPGEVATGGGLFLDDSASLNIQDSTISGNSAEGSGGGIFINDGPFTINNSTISGNTARFQGGGVFVGQFDDLDRISGGYYFPDPNEILHCTITGNVVTFELPPETAPRAAQSGSGGGVSIAREINVVNSIIALNTAENDPDIHSQNEGNEYNLAFSLIGDPGSAQIDDIDGNLFGANPLLGPLANNGGPTKTHALLENSPAIDAGDPAFQNPPFSPVFDQRGANFGRVVFGTTDMGAYEVQANEPPPEVTRFLHAVGAGAGTTAQVKVFDESGNLVCVFDAYPTFPVGARVAVADMDADGIEDVITSPGPGGGPHVQVFSGAKLLNGVAERIVSALGSFFSYDPFWVGGVFVGTGDVNGDGRVDIITGADASGGPHVVAWDNLTGDAIVSFYAYDANFRGGVRVAGGDLNGDGVAEIITGAGPGGGPHVRAFNNTGAVVHELFAYDANFLGGVYVAVGDINGDGSDDIITGAGEGGGPHTRVFSGVDLTVLRDFFAYDVNWKGGVRVGSFDFNHDGRDDIITGAGPTGGPHAIAYSGLDNSILASAYVWDLPFPFGIYVA